MKRMRILTLLALLAVMLVTTAVAAATGPSPATITIGQARCAGAGGLLGADKGATVCMGSQVWQCTWAGYSYAANWQFAADCGVGGCADGQCSGASTVALASEPLAATASLGQARCAAADGLPAANQGTTASKGGQAWHCAWAGYSYAANWQLEGD